MGLRHVAARAGVSVSTVSNVLNRPERVAPAVAERVVAAVRELGYVPNVAARRLRTGRSEGIGMAVFTIGNPYFAELVRGAEDEADAAGYTVLVGDSAGSPEREHRLLELFAAQRLDGLLVAPVSDSDELLARLRDRAAPSVLIDAIDPAGILPSVSVDHVTGGRLAAEHLLDAGCRNILFAGGPLTVPQLRDRLEGARRAVTAAGARLEVVETHTIDVGLGRDLGERLAGRAAAERPDGVFAANDQLALGLLQSLVHRGVRVPGEIAVVGYDDIAMAATSIVPLSSVRQPARALGAQAARLLMERIAAPDAPVESGGVGVGAASAVRFEPVLVPRASSGG